MQTKPVKDKDSFLRLNYLLQIANYCSQNNLKKISNFYINEMTQIAEKRVIRISKKIKQLFCKDCKQLYNFKFSILKINKKIFKVKRCELCMKKRKIFVAETKID